MRRNDGDESTGDIFNEHAGGSLDPQKHALG
jgi:hypothetical protein